MSMEHVPEELVARVVERAFLLSPYRSTVNRLKKVGKLWQRIMNANTFENERVASSLV